jgi:hypothetical protein
MFDAVPLEKLLKSKIRQSIYDIKEDDFFRIKKIRVAYHQNKKEDMDEYMEEIGDVDPEKLNKIN